MRVRQGRKAKQLLDNGKGVRRIGEDKEEEVSSYRMTLR